MKIGVISDIHANLEAFRTVLAALDQERCDRIVCAGDVVGYGPCPQECVDLVRERRIPCIMGNHEYWCLDGGREWGINPDAREALQWTRSALSAEALAWIAALPRTLLCSSLEVVHASHAWYPRWPYVLDEGRVLANFLFQSTLYTCHGHTHMPLVAVHEAGHRPKILKVHDVILPKRARCLVNVGAVGQPRDGNPAAACAVFDSRTRSLRILRIGYDVQATQRRMTELGLPERLIARLSGGR